MNALYDDRVPESWASRAWPSLRPLASWLVNVLDRYKQLESWTSDLATPKVTWLSGLFNPQAFLTAVMQVLQPHRCSPLPHSLPRPLLSRLSPRRVRRCSHLHPFLSPLLRPSRCVIAM